MEFSTSFKDCRQTVEESIQTDDIKTEYFIKDEDLSSDDTSKSESNFKTIESLNIKSEDESEFEELIKAEENDNKREAFDVEAQKRSDGDRLFSGISFPSLWEDGSRRSAFLPYKSATVLTNLQRGNTLTKTPLSDSEGFSWYEKAGRGDLTEKDVNIVEDVDAVDLDGFSALMWGAAYGQNNAVLLLLEKGADVHVRGKRLETALHLAAAGGHQEVIKHLIAFGAEPDIYDEEGNTPLMYAVHGDHPHAVQELLQEGASIFEPDIYSYAVLKKFIQAQFVIENHILSLFEGETDPT